MATARLGFLTWSAGFTQSDIILNSLLDNLDIWVAGGVKSRTTTAQPVSPTEGDTYIIPSGATGTDWAGFTINDIAHFRSAAWTAAAPPGRLSVWVDDDNEAVTWDGTAWTVTTTANPLTTKGDIYTFDTAFQRLAVGTNGQKLVADSAEATGLKWADDSATQFEFSSDVETVANQDYVLWWDAPFAGDVTKIRTKSQSGTCTLTGKINTTALGGTANSVSTTAQEQTHSTSNSFVKGDKLQFTISANSSCLDMSVIFYGDRT